VPRDALIGVFEVEGNRWVDSARVYPLRGGLDRWID